MNDNPDQLNELKKEAAELINEPDLYKKPQQKSLIVPKLNMDKLNQL